MYPISKGAVGGGSRFQAVDLLFFPCSALLFLAELPILRVFLRHFKMAPPFTGIYRTCEWGDALDCTPCTASVRHDNY